MRIEEPTEERLRLWSEWVESRPPVVRDIAKRFNPWTIYRLKSSGHRVYIYSFSEDGTLTVVVDGQARGIRLHDNRRLQPG